MWNWMAANWWYSIPLGAAAVYLGCVAVESLVYQSLNIKAKDAPAKGDFPKSITLLEALAVFDFLLWYNCGAVLWRRGLRPWLLPLFGVLLILLAVEWTRAYRRLKRPRRRGGRGYPNAAACSFCLRRAVGSFIPGWFVGFWPAAVLQSIGLQGVEGALHQLFALLMPALLPLLFLLVLWLLGDHQQAVEQAARNGTYDPLAPQEKKEKSLADLMYEAQMIDLIERGIREEEEENERRYRENWEDEYRK